MNEKHILLARIFGSTSEQTVVRYIHRNDNAFEHAIDYLDDTEIEHLESMIKPLIDKEIIGKEDGETIGKEDGEKIGNKQAKYAVSLARLMIAYKRNGYEMRIDKETISGFNSVRNAYDTLKNMAEAQVLAKNYEHAQNPLDYRITFEAAGKTYMAVFEPNETLLQAVALEKVKSCFSLGGCYRQYAEAYMGSGNIFFVPIIDMDKGSIVGRFTLGFGTRCKYDDEIRDVASVQDEQVVRLSKLHVDDSSMISENDVEGIVRRYAERVGKSLARDGCIVMKVPKGCEKIYDDYFESLMCVDDDTSLGVDIVNDARFEKLNMGLDPNQTDEEGVPLFFRVISKGETEMFLILLKEENFNMRMRMHPSDSNIMHEMALSDGGGSMLWHLCECAGTHARVTARELLNEKNREGKIPAELAVEKLNSGFLRVALKFDSGRLDVERLLKTAESDLNKMKSEGRRNIFARVFRGRLNAENTEDRKKTMERLGEVVAVLKKEVANRRSERTAGQQIKVR